MDDCVAEVPQCAGCNGEHRANSRECPLVQHAHDIEKLRSEGLSYQDPLTKLRGSYRQVIRGSSFFLMSFKNRYSIGNNV